MLVSEISGINENGETRYLEKSGNAFFMYETTPDNRLFFCGLIKEQEYFYPKAINALCLEQGKFNQCFIIEALDKKIMFTKDSLSLDKLKVILSDYFDVDILNITIFIPVNNEKVFSMQHVNISGVFDFEKEGHKLSKNLSIYQADLYE